MAEPFSAYHSVELSAIQNAMIEYWDPRVLEDGARLSEITKYFTPRTQGWDGENYLHIRVNDVMLSSARAIGNMSVAAGKTLQAPAQTMEWTEWKIGQDDLPSIVCPVRYEFKTSQILKEADVGPTAERLSRQSLASVNERIEMGIAGNQSCVLARVAYANTEFGSFSTTNFTTVGASKLRLWLKEGSAALFHKGDVIEAITPEASFVALGGTLSATQPSSMLKVTNVGYARGASGVYGYIDVQGRTSTLSATLGPLARHASHFYLLKSGEYDSDAKPNAAPVDAATGSTMYGLRDWFIAETGSPGIIYSVTRTTSGNQWTIPIISAQTAGTVVTLAMIDELLSQVYNKRLDMDNLTEYVLLTGHRLAQELTTQTGATNRRVDGTQVEKTRVYTKYGFNGVMIHHSSLDTAIAVQGVRGLAEDRAYLVQPGVLNLIMPGGVQWMPWNDQGAIWQNESTSGQLRSNIYRADRHVMCNTLIELPRMCGGLTGVVPD